MEEEANNSMTQKLRPVTRKAEVESAIPKRSVPSVETVEVQYKRVAPAYSHLIPRHDVEKVHLIEEQCRGFCLSLFFRERDPVRSLGITSSITDEGKSFVAIMMAHILANDSASPVVLVECDWKNAGTGDYFGLPVAPGLAEWLRGECTEEDMQHKINDNLTVIRAGDGQQDAVRLLQLIRKRGLRKTLGLNDENLLIDLPPVITCSYSTFAASMVDALALVVRAGITPDDFVADACDALVNLPVQGLILNRVLYRPESYPTARRKI
jgi:Mrp family chromosome partitioning ATPase